MGELTYLLDFGSEYIFVTKSYYEFVEKAIINGTDWVHIRDIRDETCFINIKQIRFIRKIENVEEYL